MMVRSSLIPVVLYAWVLLAGCSRSSATLKLGAAGPWSTRYGVMVRRGIDLAVAEANAKGGIDGQQLEVMVRDDSGDGTSAAAIAQEFVDDEAISAVIGHITSRAMIAAARIYDGRLVAVTPTASSPNLTGISRWTFRVVSSDSVAGITLGKFATSLGYKRAAILYENNTYGRGLAESFQRNFGGRVVSMDPVAEEADNFEPFVAYFRQQAPDLVFVIGQEGPGLALLGEARRQGLEAAFMGGDSWERVAADTVVSEGAYVGVPFTPEDPRPAAQQFVAAFREKYGMLPDANAALAYDATQLVVRALAERGNDRAAVRDYLAAVDSAHAHDGVTGSIRFRSDGDRMGAVTVMTRARQGQLRVEGRQP